VKQVPPNHSSPPPREPDGEGDDDDPRLAIRRHTDRCFHRVEEVVPGAHGGYIVQGVLIPRDEIAEIRRLEDDDRPPACER